jgi:hypothetical protein
VVLHSGSKESTDALGDRGRVADARRSRRDGGARRSTDFALERQPIERDGNRIAAAPPAATSYADLQREAGDYLYEVGSLNQGYLEAASCPTLMVTVPNLIFADGFESGNTSAWRGVIP